MYLLNMVVYNVPILDAARHICSIAHVCFILFMDCIFNLFDAFIFRLLGGLYVPSL